MKYITIKNDHLPGFYVIDSKARHSDYCGWNLFLAIEIWLWYLGLKPKYAFFDVVLKMRWKHACKRFKDRMQSLFHQKR